MNSPEPMNLGSPTQSPGVGSNQYMPQFLLGDMPSSNPNMQLNRNHNQGSGYKNWMGSSSPPRNGTSNFNRQSSGGYTLSSGYDSKLNNSNLIDRQSDPNFHYGHNQQSNQTYSPYLERSMASTTIMGGNIHHQSEKSGGNSQLPGAPPINRLVDVLSNKQHTSYSSNSLNNSALTPNNMVKQEYLTAHDKNDLSFTPNQTQHHRLSPPSPTQIDPFYTHGESIKMDDKLDETWITVFGFPQSATSYVLQEFSVYGQIIRHIPNPQGNWLHIQYQTKLQAQKALSKNGKILANSLMVGVMPCIDKRVMSLNPQSNDSQFQLPATPGAQTIAKSPTNVNLKTSAAFGRNATKLDRTQSLRSNVRPLGPYNGNRAERESYDDSRLPKKNGNAISKAMEYMFGW